MWIVWMQNGIVRRGGLYDYGMNDFFSMDDGLFYFWFHVVVVVAVVVVVVAVDFVVNV